MRSIEEIKAEYIWNRKYHEAAEWHMNMGGDRREGRRTLKRIESRMAALAEELRAAEEAEAAR